MTSVSSKAKVIIEETLKRTLKEWDAILKQENAWKNLLNVDQGRLRGIKLTGLRLDSTHFKHVDSNGDLEIKLDHNFPNASIARAFRKGKLVDIAKSGFNHDQAWAHVQGIISDVQPCSILVQVPNLGSSFLLSYFISCSDDNDQSINLLQRSTSGILENSAKALKRLKVHKHNHDIASQLVNPDHREQDVQEEFQTPYYSSRIDLDQDKITTVELCSKSSPLTIIHGPPGTGKTTALAAVVVSAVANGSRVLATAPSHAAVDALTLAIFNQLDIPGIKLIRIGNKLRLKNPKVESWLPRTNVDRLSQQLSHLRLELLQNSKGKKALMDEEKRIKNEINHDISTESFAQADNADIVVSTCLTALQMPEKVKKAFNIIAIDEAAFAPDWLCLPLILAGVPKVILSGDHCQLPPIVVSEDKPVKSIMEKMVDKVPTSRLNLQFRSNEVITSWSNAMFYQNRLRPHQDVKDITIDDLTKENTGLKPFMFINTQGLDYAEQNDEDGSIFNEHEALIVDRLIQKLLDFGIFPKDIGVITPYWSQVALLRHLIEETSVDISTVDGFQGCEKEAIVISFVRSNKKKVVGFLEEARRINVSITRAKRCCIIIGDAQTLQSDKKLKNLVDFCKNQGFLINYEEFEAILL